MASIMRSRFRSFYLSPRHFSKPSIPTPNSPYSTLARKQKTRAALALLKSESDPDRIFDIALSASLDPASHLDRTALSITVSKLSKAPSPASTTALRSFLDQFTSRPDHQSEPSLSHAIVLYGQAGMLDEAIRTFQNLEKLGVSKRTARSFNALLHACLLNNDHEQLVRIFREFPKLYNIAPDLTSYNNVVRSLCKARQSSSAFAILGEMGREAIKPNATTYQALLSGLYAEDKYDDVEKVLETMEKNDSFTDTSVHDVRMQSLCRAKKTGEAKTLFDEIVSSGVKPNSGMYFHLIYGFCKEGDLEEAKRQFHEMGKNGCLPGSASYFTLIHYLCRGGEFDTALQLCKECMEKDWVPCFSTMKLLVDGLVKDPKKTDEARKIVSELKDRFPKTAQLWKEVEEGLAQ